MATIIQVAELAGVSKATVSRVLSGSQLVAEETKLRVDHAIKQLGYRPNPAARALKSNRTNLIGVVIPTIESPFFGPFIGGVHAMLANTDFSLLFAGASVSPQSERRAVQSLIDRQCDGLILFLDFQVNPSELQDIDRYQDRMVMVGPNPSTFCNHQLSVDNLYGGYLAAKHLLQKGHRKIIFLSGEPHFDDARQRMQGCERALAEFGLSKKDIVIKFGPYSEEWGYEAGRDLLQKHKDCTAVLAGDDEIAAGVYTACRELGLQVGEDISVMGYDDMFFARHLYPSLTTIAQPMEEMGNQAASAIMDLIYQVDTIGRSTLLRPKLIERQSVKSLI